MYTFKVYEVDPRLWGVERYWDVDLASTNLQESNMNQKFMDFFLGYLPSYMFPIFCNFWKKDPRSKWTIYKYDSEKSKKCLSVTNFGILSVVCCL